jgi:signal transduction histidine kinase
MRIKRKAKEPTRDESTKLRQRIADLERAENERMRAEEALRRNLEERLATEEMLRQRNQELALLNRASQVFSSSLELDQVLETVLEEIDRLLNVIGCSVWLLDRKTEELICQQATGSRRDTVRGWRLAPGEGIVGWVARSEESLIVPDTRADERHFKGLDQRTGLRVRSVLSTPLRVRQDVIGVLEVVDERANRFNETDLTLLEALAASAAIAIENAQLYDRVQRYAVEMGVRVAERTRELAEANERLKELDRLKSKFVSDVSHELRTPVANIMLYVNLLERGKPERRSHHLSVLKDQARRLASLIEDILSLSRLELGSDKVVFEAVDLNQVVEQVVTAHQLSAEAANLELTVEPGPDLPPVWAEHNQLSQVVTNLVTNAINYTPAGRVWVVTCLDSTRGQACLEVQDTGRGIEAEDLPHIFERFYRGQRVGGSHIPGTGLGLAIVKEILDLHGGDIEVETRVGEGSNFRVWLPLAR